MSNPLTSPANFTRPDAAGDKALAAVAASAPPPAPAPKGALPAERPAPAPAQKPAPIDAAKYKADAPHDDDSDDAFDTLIGARKAEPAKPDAKPEADEPQAEEVHIEDTPAEPENPFKLPAAEKKNDTAPATEPQTPADPASHRARDYSKFHPDDAAILRKLPNELFAKYSVELPKLRAQAEKVKELEAKVAETSNGPKYLHEHPEAVILTPEYRNTVNDLQQTEFEANHYREQLLKIRRGEPWRVIEGFDKNGSPVYGPERPAPEGSQIDLQADIAVNAAYNRLMSDADSLKTKLSSLVSSHSTRAKAVVDEVRATNKRIFPDIDLEKLEGEEKQAADIIRKNIHPAFVDHPQSEALIYAGVHVTRLRRMLLETQEKLRKAEAALGVKQLAPAAAPTIGAAGKLAADPGKVMVNTKELYGDD